jgi:hypothetical protein
VLASSALSVFLPVQAMTAPLVHADCVEICIAEKDSFFYSFDTTDRDSVSRHYTRYWHTRKQYMDAHRAAAAHSDRGEGAESAAAAANVHNSSHNSSSTTSTSHSNSHSSMNNSTHGAHTSTNLGGGSGGGTGSRAVSQDVSSSAGNINTNTNANNNNNAVHHNAHKHALQTLLPPSLTHLLPIPPLPCATSVSKVSTKVAHFYRYISTCESTSVLFEVCLDDGAHGGRKRYVSRQK